MTTIAVVLTWCLQHVPFMTAVMLYSWNKELFFKKKNRDPRTSSSSSCGWPTSVAGRASRGFNLQQRVALATYFHCWCTIDLLCTIQCWGSNITNWQGEALDDALVVADLLCINYGADWPADQERLTAFSLGSSHIYVAIKMQMVRSGVPWKRPLLMCYTSRQGKNEKLEGWQRK